MKQMAEVSELHLKEFKLNIQKHKTKLLILLRNLRKKGKIVHGYGASTKGNVILQYCGITTKEIYGIKEINEEKFGKYTPGTNIPIFSMIEYTDFIPNYYLVLPWHFKDFIIKKEKEFLKRGGKLIFPLPKIEIIGG